MSYNETKTVLRAPIIILAGASTHDAYMYYREFLGEPEELLYFSDNEDIVSWFGYSEEQINESRMQPCFVGENWGIEHILHYHMDEGDTTSCYEGWSIEDLTELSDNMVRLFDVRKEDVRLFSYTWYNGVDEPVVY